jgi:hypothetical protein
MGHVGIEQACKKPGSYPWVVTEGDTTRSRSGMREQISVVELVLSDHDVGVGVRGDGEVPLPDVLADPRPGEAGQVKQRDPPMAEVVGRKRGDTGGGACPCDRCTWNARRFHRAAAQSENPSRVGETDNMKRRGSTTARGYEHVHQQLRKRWQRVVESGSAVCARCGLPIERGEFWDLGHVNGDKTRYAGPEHRRCNRATNKGSAKVCREW